MLAFSTAGIQEYIFTAGIIVAFIGTVLGFVASWKSVRTILKGLRFTKRYLLIALAIVLVFIVMEKAIVKPAQQLFFDDAIYQGGALDLIHMGQAWMCNYGSPTQCFSGEIFHEPVGTAFNLALGYLLMGVSESAAFNAWIFITAFSVFLVFFVALLMFEDIRTAFFAELIMGLMPIILIWAAPTTSDILMMFYSTIAVFGMLVFVRKKNAATFSFALFSLALAIYMKVNGALYLLVIPVAYLLLDNKSIRHSVIANIGAVRKNILNTKLLTIFLIFLLLVVPEIMYVHTENISDTYGYVNAPVMRSCNSGYSFFNATGTINLQNFQANICSNVGFWFNMELNKQGNYYIIQPTVFTALALLGMALLIAYRRRLALTIGLWFLAFFLLYTAFYAGAVTYGVDWRFMLAVAPPMALLGGFGIGKPLRMLGRVSKNKIIMAIAIAGAVALLFATTLLLYGYLNVQPILITQQETPLLYEKFISENIGLIPSNCLVFSYVPELFNINNRTATQFGNLSYIQSSSGYAQYKKNYSCFVADLGYWCAPQDNRAYCRNTLNYFTYRKLAAVHDNLTDYNFSFYSITGLNRSKGN